MAFHLIPTRDLSIPDLLEYVLGRCGHEPGDCELAVCDTCANVVTMLVCRIREDRDGQETLH